MEELWIDDNLWIEGPAANDFIRIQLVVLVAFKLAISLTNHSNK